jgi:pyruvate,water dikinase
VGEEYVSEDYLKVISSLANQAHNQEELIKIEHDLVNDEYTNWLISSLRRVVYIFDEAKTALVRAAWAMRKTLSALGFDEKIILDFTEDEFREWLNNDQVIPNTFKLEDRKEYYAFYSHGDTYKYLFGKDNVENLIQKEQLELLEKISGKKEIIGTVARKGRVRGRVKLVHNQKDAASFQDGEILVTSMTTPELLGAMYKSVAFITDEGGVTCHAAIIARELNKPCIIGTRVATQVLKDGDMVEVDANIGIIRIL